MPVEPMPAAVVMMPSVPTRRMRPLKVSAMYRLPARVHRHALGPVQPCAARRSAIAQIAGRACPRHGRNRAVRGHLAHHIIAGVRDVQAAGGIQRDAERSVDLRAGGRAAVARVPGRSAACHGGDGSVGGDLAHHRGIPVRHEDVARRIDRDAHREAQLRRGRRSAVAGIAGASVAREAGQGAGGIHFEDGVQTAEVDVPRRIGGHPRRISDGGGQRLAGRRWRGAARDCRYHILLRPDATTEQQKTKYPMSPHASLFPLFHHTQPQLPQVAQEQVRL